MRGKSFVFLQMVCFGKWSVVITCTICTQWVKIWGEKKHKYDPFKDVYILYSLSVLAEIREMFEWLMIRCSCICIECLLRVMQTGRLVDVLYTAWALHVPGWWALKRIFSKMKSAFGHSVDRVGLSPVTLTYHSCLLTSFNNPQLSVFHLSIEEKAGKGGMKQ